MGIEHLNLQLATTNMKQFIILSVCLASAMAFKSYNMAHKHDAREAENHDNCVDISYYDDVEYNNTITKMCGYKKNTHCVPRQTQVCRDIPITECRIVGPAQSRSCLRPRRCPSVTPSPSSSVTPSGPLTPMGSRSGLEMRTAGMSHGRENWWTRL